MADTALPPLPKGAVMMPPLPPGAVMYGAQQSAPRQAGSPTSAQMAHGLETAINPIASADYTAGEIGDAIDGAWQQLKQDWQASRKLPDPGAGFWKNAEAMFKAQVASGKIPIDAFNLVVSPVGGLLHGAVIKPAASVAAYGINHLLPGFASEQDIEKGINEGALALGPEAGSLEAGVSAEGGLTQAVKKPPEGPLGAAVRRAQETKPPPAAGSQDLGLSPESQLGKAADKGAARSAAKTQPKPTLKERVTKIAEPPAQHVEDVKTLHDAGVDLTLGQMRGGIVRRAEEAHKSNPLLGQSIREAENRATQTMNRAVYNKILGNIGEKYVGDQVGREGVKAVGDRLNKAFEAIKPQLKAKLDDEWLGDVSEIRTRVGEMPDAQEKQFETILNNRVLKRMGPDGSLDGATFKKVESELTHLAGTYGASADAAHRELGQAIRDVITSLRGSLERNSDPSVRERLKNLNTAWAMLTRLEGASIRRAASGGNFSGADLLQAVKTADKSSRKRAFARGDALLQDFAESAERVLGNHLPDSGTEERREWNTLSGLALRGVGKITNPAATAAVEAIKKAHGLPEGAKAPQAIPKTASEMFAQAHRPSATAKEILKSRPAEDQAKILATEKRVAEAIPPVVKDQAGLYLPERQAAHEAILDGIFTPEAVARATPAPGEKPTAILLGGRGGSGKSWLLGEGGPVDPSKAIMLNSDDFKAQLPGYEGWNAAHFHEESTDILAQAEKVATEAGLNVIYDATLKTDSTAAQRVATLQQAGYEVKGYYMFTAPDVAASRAMDRFLRGGEKGRYVPLDVILGSQTNERTFDRLKESFSDWAVYDNNTPGKEPKLVLQKGKKK